MSTPSSNEQPDLPQYKTERVIASLTMAWVIILTTYMIFQDHALSHSSMYFLKIVLSMSGGVMLATLPGFIDINYSLGGLSVRAAGGAAAFVFIFTQSPSLPALKLDPAQARPALRQEHVPPGPDKLSANDEFPVLVALSIDPAGLLPAPAQGGGGLWPVESGGSAGIGLGSALLSDAQTFADKAAAVLRSIVSGLRAALDRAAASLRSGIDKLVGMASRLLGPDSVGSQAVQTIVLATETVAARVEHVTDSLTSGLDEAVGGIVAATDGTVQTLAAGAQSTVHQLLDTTQGLTGGLTGLLDETTGGLTTGLTRPVNALVGELNATAGGVVDGVFPVATETTSRILTGVGKGLDTITDRLNAVSPSLLAQIDPDFAAAQLLDAAALAAPTHLLGDLAGGDGLLKRGTEGALFANRFSDPLGGEGLAPGRGCISGCGQNGLLPALRGGLRDTGSGLRQVPLLSGLSGNGASGGGSGAGSASAAGDGAASGRGGLVSSTVGRTGSVVKGVTKSLRRR